MQISEVRPGMLSGCNEIEPEINHRKITGELPATQKLNNTPRPIHRYDSIAPGKRENIFNQVGMKI